MKKNLIIASLAIIISLGAAYSVSAWQGEINNQEKQEIKEEKQEAIVSQDYQTWLEIKSERSSCGANVVNEENFHLFSKAHELLRQEETEKAQEIFNQLGREMPEKQMGREGSFRSEGQRPHRGRNGQAPFGNHFRNQ